MSQTSQNSPFEILKRDLPASLVVALVALPLCLGIALASGAPLMGGIIAGIVGGIIVGAASGSALGVSGPAAGLAVIVLSAISTLGSYETFLVSVIIAGAIQIGLGLARAGVIGYYFPSSVIKGMLSGIGIVIILKQIPHAFGYDADPIGDFEFFQPDAHNTFSELYYMLDGITPGALLVSLVGIGILILWEQPFIKRQSFATVIQGPLVVVVWGIAVAATLSGVDGWAISADHMVSIPVAASFGDLLSQLTMPDFSQIANPQVLITGVTIAIVASLETLLCVEATDKLDPEKRVTPTNRELIAQGVGNICSGAIGGLPVTQVIVRSSANIQSGGNSKVSAISHGFLLLVCAAAVPGLINKIPLAALAAILLSVGYKLAKPSLMRSMYAKGPNQFIPFAVTILGIVFTDLLVGIGLGLAVGVTHILWKNYKQPYKMRNPEDANNYIMEFSQQVTFLNKAGIQRALNELPDGCSITIDARGTQTIDADVIEIIEEFMQRAPARSIEYTTLATPELPVLYQLAVSDQPTSA